MLEQAKGDYYAGPVQLAITGFEQLINAQFPSTEAAAEAQYLDRRVAVQSEQVAGGDRRIQPGAAEIPRASYASEALYKRGVAQRRLGDTAAARASYEQASSSIRIRRRPASPSSDWTVFRNLQPPLPRA